MSNITTKSKSYHITVTGIDQPLTEDKNPEVISGANGNGRNHKNVFSDGGFPLSKESINRFFTYKNNKNKNNLDSGNASDHSSIIKLGTEGTYPESAIKKTISDNASRLQALRAAMAKACYRKNDRYLETDRMILESMDFNEPVSISQIVERSGVHRETVRLHLRDLLKRSQVYCMRAGRWCKWIKV